MTPSIPAAMTGTSAEPSWSDWVRRLPSLIAGVRADWSLTPDGPVATGSHAYVLPVLDGDGRPAVLKLGYPRPAAEHEHLALRAWAGDGAVRLLRADPHRWALLLERADPSRSPHDLPVLEACSAVADLYPRLHRPAIPQLARLSEQAAQWADRMSELHDHPSVPRRLIEHAVSLARDFASDPGTDGRLIHTDLHFDNVLGSDRGDRGRLAIGPKPVSGDPAYEVAPLLWNRWDEAVATGDLRNAILDRIFTVVDRLGLDEDRVRDWVIVRELVNVLRALVDDQESPDSGWVTTAIVIAKAAQR